MRKRCWATLALAITATVGGLVLTMGCEPAPTSGPAPAALWSWSAHPNNPVLTPAALPAKPGAAYGAMADPVVLRDGSIYKMWFGYGGLDDARNPESVRVRTAYAESSDGVSWKVLTVPVLADATGNAWDKTNVETPSVVKDDSLPDGHPRKYRLYYAGLDHAIEKLAATDIAKYLEAGMAYGIGLAFSADGKTFTRLPAAESPYGLEGLALKPNPVVADQDAWDLMNIADPHVVKRGDTYHLWYTSMGRQVKDNVTTMAIAYAASPDGIRWTKHGVVLKHEAAWETRRQPSVGRPYVLWTGERFEMFYDAMKDDDNPLENTVMGVGFATSTDGKTWTKASAPVFTGTRGPGETRGVLVGVAALRENGAYKLYYPGAGPSWDNIQINLATSAATP